MHPMAAIAAKLDAVGCYAAETPRPELSATDTTRISTDRREGVDHAFDDDLIMVVAVAGENDGAIAAKEFTHDSPHAAHSSQSKVL